MANTTLTAAKKAKNDEFYTRLEDIETEISMHPDYVKQFQGKTVLCNCDDPTESKFFWFFRIHFKQLGLKKIITTHYNKDGTPSYKLEWEGEMLRNDPINLLQIPLEGDGDFRSDECVELMKEADIVVTNPPFSLFKEYISLLTQYNKKFVIIGSKNAITYKELFPLLKDNKVWCGYGFPSGNAYFRVRKEDAESYGKGVYDETTGLVKFRNVTWYTNLDIDKRHEKTLFEARYEGNEKKYQKYDNFDAINVDKVKDIPRDYDGMMGVPITFMDIYCSEQFEIIGNSSTLAEDVTLPDGTVKKNPRRFYIGGKRMYDRIVIRKIKEKK